MYNITNSVKCEIKTATKTLVDSLLQLNTKNRNPREGVIECYKRDLAGNRWFLTNQGIGVSRTGFLLDGQHRLMAIKEMGYPPVPLLIVTGLDPECQEVIDQHAKRSVRDIWRLFMESDVATAAPAICAVLYKNANKWVSGKISPTELRPILDEHIAEISFVLQSTSNTKFWAAPYLGAFVTSAKEFPDRWEEIKSFISRVHMGENLNRKMSEFHLRNFVLNSRLTSGGHSIQQERFLKTRRALLATLNGEEMGVLRA